VTARSKNIITLKDKVKIELAKRELARRSLLAYTKYTMPEFQSTKFHDVYYKFLQYFADGKLKKGIITVPPQHGKSEGSSRRLPSYIHGKDPNKKIAVLSYAATFAQGFNRDNQRIINSQRYAALFPNTRLPYVGEKGKISNSTRFDLSGEDTRGFLKTVGRGGSLTGDPVDIAILDDLYKDSKEGNSPVIRAAVIDWYTSVVMKRLHNDSQQLIVFTRWHEEDLIGWLEENDIVILVDSWEQLDNINPEYWYKINFPALMDKLPTELDPREMGEPLYPEKHSKAKLEKERKLDPQKFESMNQGNPAPKEGLLYGDFKTYKLRPRDIKRRSSYTDTADKGDDYLCSITYDVGLDDYVYITDILYTQKPQEETEPETANLFKRNFIKHGVIESNNGGRGFARNVDRLCGHQIVIETFHQSQNKESRILTNASEVTRKVLMPDGWDYKYPEFYKAITRFKRQFKANKHDDAPDTLTGVLEHSGVCDTVNDALYRM
jgi:predicted phage terminase large subunit-like protein